jgi:hypothetical protein
MDRINSSKNKNRPQAQGNPSLSQKVPTEQIPKGKKSNRKRNQSKKRGKGGPIKGNLNDKKE